ncbi:Short-chain dehydrogenase/reductase [Cladobotryum mycophilum]|uniref:Short-chain dehydrogenase/reductase n=1 Tax=Cladobotryum mycophilum TaxID=491253 RepID=A0ABR0SAK0_9HYPO
MGLLTQMFPPNPPLPRRTWETCPVYIITGSNTGVGKELAQILYSRNGTVYIAARSRDKANEAINSIRKEHPSSGGRLEFLALDLADLKAVAESARAFLAKETKLDVLFNNAGLAVHNVGHQLLTEMLTPVLAQTAASYASAGGVKNQVRVVWVSSAYSDMAPANGFDPENINYEKKDESKYYKYSQSKAGTIYQGTEYARRFKDQGIISIPLNPGNLKSDLQRHHAGPLVLLGNLILYHPIHGAYTELFAGLSPEVTMEKSGSYVYPWGRFASMRADLEKGTRSKSEGGLAWRRFGMIGATSRSSLL